MSKIVPCLWFDNAAEEAAEFYVSVFKDSRIKNVAHYGDAGANASGRPKGSVMTVSFELEGQNFLALNGGPAFTFSPAISLIVNCKTQKKIDKLWKKLSADPAEIGKMMAKDSKKSDRASGTPAEYRVGK